MSQFSSDVYELILVVTVMSGGLLLNAFRKYKTVRKVEDTARSNIATAPQGYVEFQGFAWPMKNTVPCTKGFEAVYYSFLLQRREKQGSGKNRRVVWVTKYSYTHQEPFYIVDSTGLAIIMPEGVNFDLESARTQNWSALSASEKAKVVERVGGAVPSFPPSSIFFGLLASPYRIVENEIRVGSPLYSHGDFKSMGANPTSVRALGLTEFFNRVFDLEQRRTRDLKRLLDSNGDGQVSGHEAKNGYTLAANMALKKAMQGSVEEKEFQLHGRLQTSQVHPLFVADVHQHHLVYRMKRFLWLQFAAPTVALALCLMALIDPQALINSAAGFRQAKPSLAQPQVVRRPAAQVHVSQLHQQCIAGLVSACDALIKDTKKFNLGSEHVRYYGAQACRGGLKNYCK